MGRNVADTGATVKDVCAATVISGPGFGVVPSTGRAGDRMPYSPKLAWSATAEYLFDVGSMQGQVCAVLRWVGDRVNDTTERQRVTAPGDPSTILDEQIT